MLKKKLICLGLIATLFTFNITFALGAVLGTDSEKDLRSFPTAWLETNTAELEEWGSYYSGLDAIYRTLSENWDNSQACSSLSVTDYNTYSYIDILSIDIIGLDEVNATFTITVAGDAENAAMPWIAFVWSNCSPTDAGFYFMAVGGLGDLGDGDWEAFFGVFGEDNITGDLSFGEGGSEINMNFPSAWWDEDATCALKVMLVTVDSVDDIQHYIIDIYPDPEVPLLLNLWFWVILIVILFLIAIAAYVIYRNSKQSRRKTHKRRVK